MNHPDELQWNKEERLDLESKIIALRDDQIAALLNLVKLYFSLKDIEHVVKEIRTEKNNSIHLDILLTEADSKENLLWWLDYFEKSNKIN